VVWLSFHQPYHAAPLYSIERMKEALGEICFRSDRANAVEPNRLASQGSALKKSEHDSAREISRRNPNNDQHET
jgi:hypothetical protein